MARVRMNSATKSQPAIKGLIKKKIIGFMIRKRTIVILYQLGLVPKKFLRNA
ncbi:hypothetical protein AAUPMC_00535 [Pasteurella multocida subsp. multocida str. Anand1_cattle]|nr:hypothetical protein AAUPMC_00535 [Pasteurella multocida subsp. multocida str. Anand1_cattle]WGE14653.1 hypothetical protein PM3_1285 [Pasteurella multocida]